MTHKFNWKRWATLGSLATASAALLWFEPALAKSAGEMGGHVATQGTNLAKAVSAMSFVGGIGAGAASAYKFKASRENPHQHPVGHAFGWLVACGMLLYLPQMAQNTADTFHGTGAAVNKAEGISTISTGGG